MAAGYLVQMVLTKVLPGFVRRNITGRHRTQQLLCLTCNWQQARILARREVRTAEADKGACIILAQTSACAGTDEIEPKASFAIFLRNVLPSSQF
ncbi:hypothetical protein NPIL_355451 [Nephila pilipes]|uniref:Uncharacterized protein n=1 Tax=Nephila pilipes TaxID=299642 RepID=A0A8X6QNC7_NEPPI|nr:hypothetical protein NPIL_355451 [Nephila pilipes]